MAQENDLPGKANNDLPFVFAFRTPQSSEQHRRQKKQKPPAPGDRCPQCTKGRLDYDGLLHLSCANCGYSLTGGAGCT